MAFEEGSAVRKGKLLYTIDPREYEAALSQAKGRVAQAQADLARYDQDVARYQPLVEQNALPKQNLDTAVAQANAGRANVEAAQAAVTQAQLNLSYTKIYAPTDGIIGKTEVNVGNLVGQGQNTLLTQISQVGTYTFASPSLSGTTSTTRAGARSVAVTSLRGGHCRSSWSSRMGPCIPTKVGSCSSIATWTL